MYYVDNDDLRVQWTGEHRSGATQQNNRRDCRALDNRFNTRPAYLREINAFCAEVQVIYELWNILNHLPNNSHDILIRLFTTWTPCAACLQDLTVLHQIFPQTEIVIRAGSQYVQNNVPNNPGLNPLPQPRGAQAHDNLLKLARFTSNQQ
jgi:hypothetical protein